MSNGSKGDGATMPLGSRVPSTLRPAAAEDDALVSVGRCVKVTETKGRLSGSELVTVLGGTAVAHLLSQPAQTGPALRIVPAEVSLPGLPAQAQRLSRIKGIVSPPPAQQSPAPARATAEPPLAVPAAPRSPAQPPVSQHGAARSTQAAPGSSAGLSERSISRAERLTGRASVAVPPSQGSPPPSAGRASSHAIGGQTVLAVPRSALDERRSQQGQAAPSARRSLAVAPVSEARAPSARALPLSQEHAPPAPRDEAVPGRPELVAEPPRQRAARPAQEQADAAPLAQPGPAERAAPPPEPDAGAPRRELFRRAAVEAHAVGPRVTDTDDPKHGAWGMLVLLLSLVAAIFCGAALLTVEVTVRAPGALRAPNGLRSVESVISGAVTQVLVRAGEEVAANQIVARLEETQLRASLTSRERELESLKRETEAAAEADAALLSQTTQAMLNQRAALARRSQIHQTQMRQRSAQLDNVRELRRHGVATGNDELSGEEQVQAAAESMALIGSQLAELNLALAERQREWKQRELDRRASLVRAVAAVDEAKALLAMAEVRSPAAGVVESLLVHPGAVVQPGEVLAQIVPGDAPRSIVAFLPSREMSFVSVGSEANVEVESLPVNEFGMARARVSRISSDVAKAEEIAKDFGEVLPGANVRVELTLLETDGQDKMAPHLRSGERVLVRLHRRQQRVLSMIFEFARKWLDS